MFSETAEKRDIKEERKMKKLSMCNKAGSHSIVTMMPVGTFAATGSALNMETR